MPVEIIGHEKQKKILVSSFRNKRIAHAYLFLGEDGVGKRALAVEFAKLVNCEYPDFAAFKACSGCASCIKQEKSLNPDISVVEPDGAVIKVRQIKALLEAQSLSSYFNKYKFVIIDNAERLTRDAVPMLLKTIEEPLENRIFILVTSKENIIPATIKSRCQTLKFGVLTYEQVKDLLISKGGVSESLVEYASRTSEGSAAKALELIEDSNIELRNVLFQMLDAYYSFRQLFDIKSLRGKFDKLSAVTGELLACFFYDVLKTKIKRGVIYNKDKEDLVRKYAGFLPLENISNIIKEFDKLRVLISRNISLNLDLVINNILIKGDSRND